MAKIGLGLKRFIKCALIFFFHRIVLNFMVFFLMDMILFCGGSLISISLFS